MASSRKMHSAYPVGMVCIVGRPCMGNPAGARALVYETYEIGTEHFGIGLIFPNGAHDGFSEECAEIFDVVPVKICKSLADYEFRDVGRLGLDFHAGRFRVAFN